MLDFVSLELNMVRMFTGMLKLLMDTDLDAKQMDFAETAHGSGKDLISLINEVLDQAKIESGRLELENVPFDLRFLLDNISSLLSGKAAEKGIEVDTTQHKQSSHDVCNSSLMNVVCFVQEQLAVYVSSNVPAVIVGDPGRFRQIITNLVGNSIKVFL